MANNNVWEIETFNENLPIKLVVEIIKNKMNWWHGDDDDRSGPSTNNNNFSSPWQD